MPVLNLKILDNTIVGLTRRATFDSSQMSEYQDIDDFWNLPLGDFYSGYIYALNATDMTTITDWLDSKSFTYGTPEDITPESAVQAWLDNYEATEKIGGKAKEDVYTALKVSFPSQECIPEP